jgi:hypothetical protein
MADRLANPPCSMPTNDLPRPCWILKNSRDMCMSQPLSSTRPPVPRTKARTYIMHSVHGVPYGLDFKSRFDVLRFGNPGGCGWYWHWQSLPLPPFIFGSHEKTARVISYTMVEDGRTICVSSLGEGTCCFDTAKGEWWQAGDWVLPFDGRVVYVPDLKLCMVGLLCPEPQQPLCYIRPL